jgi:phosphopantothenoylcysteine decarboxylase/phosphopantothenate--cysteine ligase
VVLMSAAVADIRPDRRKPGKIKKSPRTLILRFVPTPDILAELGRAKRPGQVLVGFALESSEGRENAEDKLRRKNLDLIVLNTPAAMGAERSTVELIFADGASERIEDTPKGETARRIVESALQMATARA